MDIKTPCFDSAPEEISTIITRVSALVAKTLLTCFPTITEDAADKHIGLLHEGMARFIHNATIDSMGPHDIVKALDRIVSAILDDRDDAPHDQTAIDKAGADANSAIDKAKES